MQDKDSLCDLILQQYRLEGEEVIRISTGRPVGASPDRLGYIRFRLASGSRGGGRSVRLHQVKFLLLHGYIPDYIDHADRDPLNNHSSNLREATRQQNMLNRRQPPQRLLPRGVYKSKRGLGYYASCTFNKTRHHLGYFKTVAEAERAVEDFRRKHHGEFYAEP